MSGKAFVDGIVFQNFDGLGAEDGTMQASNGLL